MHYKVFMILLFVNSAVRGQIRKGFEAYYYPVNGVGFSSLSTKLYYQTSQGWYTECRYNYEEEGTAACSVGKTFSKEKYFSYSITPEVGLSGGKLQGASLGLNSTLSRGRLSFNSSLLYAPRFERNKGAGSVFSWSELNGRISKHLYAGVTIELSSSPCTTMNLAPGGQLEVLYKDWTFPFYVFDRRGAQPYVVAAACYEWKYRQ
jgi:hypothetical protein